MAEGTTMSATATIVDDAVWNTNFMNSWKALNCYNCDNTGHKSNINKHIYG